MSDAVCFHDFDFDELLRRLRSLFDVRILCAKLWALDAFQPNTMIELHVESEIDLRVDRVAIDDMNVSQDVLVWLRPRGWNHVRQIHDRAERGGVG